MTQLSDTYDLEYLDNGDNGYWKRWLCHPSSQSRCVEAIRGHGIMQDGTIALPQPLPANTVFRIIRNHREVVANYGLEGLEP